MVSIPSQARESLDSKEYCLCELPIRVSYRAESSFKIPFCSACLKQVDPRSKAVNKAVDKLNLSSPTRNEKVLQDKLNELIDLVRANGGMIG